MNAKLNTARLTLLSCDETLLKAAIAGDKQLADYLNVTVADNWTEFRNIVLQYALDQTLSSQTQQAWWTYFPIHKHELFDRQLRL